MFTLVTLSILITIIVAFMSLIFYQARYVKNNAIRLPEADGSRNSGENIQTSHVTLLHLGESTVAGVGVGNINEGLTANVVNALEHNSQLKVHWTVMGKNGITASDAMQFEPVVSPVDIVILTLGVNDTTKFTGVNQWVTNLNAVVDKFCDEQTHVVFTAVPPMSKFPLLPFPLNFVLGLRANLLNRALKKLCVENRWLFVDAPFGVNEELMAHDGYHPNKKGYQRWGQQIAQQIIENVEL